MTTIALFNYWMPLGVADVVASPRGARISWTAIKVHHQGKQEAPF